jgi:hypothetical protein
MYSLSLSLSLIYLAKTGSRLALNSQSHCLSLLHVGVIGESHHAWPIKFYLAFSLRNDSLNLDGTWEKIMKTKITANTIVNRTH